MKSGRHGVKDDADFVIVGTGAGGATAAEALTRFGFSVILVEEGKKLLPHERPRELARAMQLAVRDMGTQATHSRRPIVLLQGKLVGGSTAINSGICWRTPDDVRADWARRFGLDALVNSATLERAFTRIESDLGIVETPEEALGENSRALRRGALALGMPGKPTMRNAKGCQGFAQCLQGCPGGARQSMDVSYIPLAVERGARLYTEHRVDQVVRQGSRAVGVRGREVSLRGEPGPGKPFEFRARHGVILAAGAIHTPLIMLRSGFGGQVGRHFQAHPGAAVVARFPTPIRMAEGATQGFEVPRHDEGFKIESLALPPEMLAARLPGAGAEWETRLAHLEYYAQWVVHVKMEAEGRVSRSLLGRNGLFGGEKVTYEPTTKDLDSLKKGLSTTIKMMFAAGATEVYPGLNNLPEVVTHPNQLKRFDAARLGPSDAHLVASHLFASARASVDKRHGVVNADLESHELGSLYVLDASALPTNLGVNPQHTIMALVSAATERLAEKQRPMRVA